MAKNGLGSDSLSMVSHNVSALDEVLERPLDQGSHCNKFYCHNYGADCKDKD